jgi:hypothetical protein
MCLYLPECSLGRRHYLSMLVGSLSCLRLLKLAPVASVHFLVVPVPRNLVAQVPRSANSRSLKSPSPRHSRFLQRTSSPLAPSVSPDPSQNNLQNPSKSQSRRRTLLTQMMPMKIWTTYLPRMQRQRWCRQTHCRRSLFERRRQVILACRSSDFLTSHPGHHTYSKSH